MLTYLQSRSPADNSRNGDRRSAYHRDSSGEIQADGDEEIASRPSRRKDVDNYSNDDGDDLDDIGMQIKRPDSRDSDNGPLTRGLSMEVHSNSTPKPSTETVAEAKKKQPPMPAGPAPTLPRKARDVLASATNSSENGPRRPSIDSMLTGESKRDIKGEDSDNDLVDDLIKVH
jgi:hypothetical protein